MTFVIKRKIDELGRLVLPIDYRNHYSISEGDGVVLSLSDNGILVKKDIDFSINTKTVDALGRILIPKSIRSKLNLEAKSTLEVHPHEEGILLVPAEEEPETTPAEIMARFASPSEGSSVYEQDYRKHREQYHEMVSSSGRDDAFNLIMELGIMKDIDRRFLELPHIINPTIKTAYEHSLLLLDSWAMLKGGQIKGEVSYEKFDACITVIFPFFEFIDEASIEYLRYLSTYARSITFCPAAEGGIELRVSFNYFEDFGDKNAIIEEEIQKHPELVDALIDSANAERKLILDDPIMQTFISKAAEDACITPEEYLDRFEALWEEDPMVIMEILHNELRKKAEQADDASSDTDE